MLFALIAFFSLPVSGLVYVLKPIKPHSKTIMLMGVAVGLCLVFILRNLLYSLTYKMKSLVYSPEVAVDYDFWSKVPLERVEHEIALADWFRDYVPHE